MYLVGPILEKQTAFHGYACVGGCRQNTAGGAADVPSEVVSLTLNPGSRVRTEVDGPRAIERGEVSRQG